MRKLVATANVIAWSGFWAFGYLALSAGVDDSRQLVVALVMAALGLLFGIFTWLKTVQLTGPGHWRHVRQAEDA